METDPLVTILAMILVGLIALSVLFWFIRLVWGVVSSPTALAILLALLALLVGFVALQATSG
jgi:hypothetical protein